MIDQSGSGARWPENEKLRSFRPRCHGEKRSLYQVEVALRPPRRSGKFCSKSPEVGARHQPLSLPATASMIERRQSRRMTTGLGRLSVPKLRLNARTPS